jgi:ATP-binding cassette subfamily E protein 1
MRVAVIDYTLCKPRKCSLECIRFCPVNRSRRGSKAIELSEETGKPIIYEESCIGCNICVKKCPFNAISIVNLPDELGRKTVHRFGRNAFKLHGLPIPKEGQVIGIIGKNGTGKTTSIRILAGEIKPNLGDYEREKDWDDIIKFFRGSELQSYFQRLADGKLKVVHKTQYIDLVPRHLKGRVKQLLEKADERGIWRELAEETGLEKLHDRNIRQLSGGELQKLLITAVLSKEADVYIFDEPSSYLDVKERMRISRIIRERVPKNAYTLVVEHDLAVLDYLSDNVNIIFGEPGVYGIVSKPYGTRVGINNFLNGYLPAENIRLRKEPIRFHATGRDVGEEVVAEKYLEWDNFTVKLDGFTLEASEGYIGKGEVIGIMGPNGIGKTTFVNTMAKMISEQHGTEYKISYKPQYVSHEIFAEKTVGEALEKASPYTLTPGHWLYEEITRPFNLFKYKDRKIESLSGGEMQKLAVAVSLAKEADIYLLDEPSAYLDVEERLRVAKVIKRLTESRSVAAFVVEHDVSLIDFICNRLMVFRGEPGVHGMSTSPLSLREGMNMFLSEVGITFRRDPITGRPRVNKENSYLDRMQKKIGEYYYIPKEKE